MITVRAVSSRPRRVPFAHGVMEGRLPVLPGTAALLTRNQAGLDRQRFDGKLGQVATLDGGDVAVGLGGEVSVDGLRAAAGTLGRSLGRLDRLATNLTLVPLDGAARAVAEGLILGGYRYTRYKSSDPNTSPVVELIGADSREVERAINVASGELLARDLVNLPAVDKAPVALAQMMAEAVTQAGGKAEIWDAARCQDERLSGLLTVAAGSHRPPCLLRLSYRSRRPQALVALVGKGVVFDSGGLSLKTAENMEWMKTDMSGAAAVAGAVATAARLRLRVAVEAYLPLTDNMPGGAAVRPGDVITYRNGKTIEVLNTDAEGRLILADGLILASETKPDLMVDVATLTGAMRIALGDRVGGLFGSDAATVDLVKAAGDFTGERLWPMPLVDDYRRLIESEIADMKNTSGRYGGAIAAALILREFTADQTWAHLDIAGPARCDHPYGWITRGGTGFGTRTLVRVLELMAGGR
ncbi:MAG TPA: leucyl aminopeptidase [Acidimicrobiia bacterium]|nr:leucyl aminopeptidase [Acidimicrobiia bacterium]